MQQDIPSAEQFHETGGLQNAMIYLSEKTRMATSRFGNQQRQHFH